MLLSYRPITRLFAYKIMSGLASAVNIRVEMGTATDSQLLQSFAENRSQEAFAQLVARYANLVYSAARRQSCDCEMAQDVTQAVFIILANKAAGLSEKTILAGWLVCTARYAAQNAMKTRARRIRHEQRAAAMRSEQLNPPHEEADDLLPHLDNALSHLPHKDRDVVVLRFLQQMSVAEVSAAIGISEDAAQKRISRALEKLRHIFSTSSIAFSSSALAFVPVHTAPSSLTGSVLTNTFAAAQSASSVSIAHSAMRMMTWIKLQFAGAIAASVILTGGIGTLIVHKSLARSVSAPAPSAVLASNTSPAPSTPADVLRQINQAWMSNDPHLYAKQHLPGTPEEEAYASALGHMLAGRGKFVAAYNAKFPVDKNNPHPGGFSVRDAVPHERLDAAQVTQIDDHTVDIAIPDGMTYHIVLSQGAWHIALQQSMASMYPSDPVKAMKLLSGYLDSQAKVFSETADQISTGKLASAQDVTTVLNAELKKISAGLADMPPAKFILLPNNAFGDTHDSAPGFTCAEDPTVKHYDQPAMLLTATTAKPLADGHAFSQVGVPAWRGKRMLFSVWLKCEDVHSWAGPALVVIAKSGKWESVDFSGNQNLNQPSKFISATTDWTKLQTVADVPDDAKQIMLAVQLKGNGKVWIDDPRIEAVGKGILTTDDQNLHLWSDYSSKYALAMDPNEKRNGHPTIRVTPNRPPTSAHCWIGIDHRQPGNLPGHHLILSAWIKAEKPGSHAFLSMVAAIPGRGVGDQEFDERAGKPYFPLSTEWKKYQVAGDAPVVAQVITQGLFIWGNNKVWVDDFKIEDTEAYDTP